MAIRTQKVRRGRHGVWARLGLAAVGLAMGLAVAEAACKVIDVRTARKHLRLTERISRPSALPGVRFELIPGATGITPSMPYEIRVNQWGFRGPEVALEKPQGTWRIAVLGDSIAFGRTYDESEIFPTLLQEGLARRYPDLRIEVLNASLSGRDTWEEAAILEHRVLPLQPDVVILQICLNDHVRLAPPDRASGVGAFGELPWYRYSSLLRLLDYKVPGFRDWHWRWLDRLGSRPSGKLFLRNQRVTHEQILDVGTHWEEWSRELLRVRDLTRGAGAEVLFVVFPVDWVMKEGRISSLPELTALAEKDGIPLLDMIAFYGSDTRSNLRDYTHPSRRGHRVAAVEIERVIAAYLDGQSSPSGDAPTAPDHDS